jgi:DNA-binding transcriptional LysR family regulator
LLKDAHAALKSQITEVAGEIRFGVVGSLANARLTSALRRFGQDHPDVRLAISTGRSTEISDLVRRGALMFGIRYEVDSGSDIECTLLGKEQLIVVAAHNHVSAGARRGSLVELRDERWLAFPQAAQDFVPTHIADLFRSLGVREIDWSPVDSLTAQKRLAEAGLGLALLPSSAVEEELAAGTLKTLVVDGLSASLAIAMIVRRDGFQTVAAKELMKALSSVYESRPPLDSGDESAARKRREL